MKKFVMGLVVGLLISLTTTAFGAAGLIGSKIESVMQVSLNGKPVGTAVVSDGVSYLPVRAVANAMHLQTTVSKGGIQLSSETQDLAAIAKKEQSELDANTAEFNKLNQAHYMLLRSVADKERAVTNLQNVSIARQQAKVDAATTPQAKEQEEKYLVILTGNLAAEQAKLAELQASLKAAADALNAYVAEHAEFKDFISKLNS